MYNIVVNTQYLLYYKGHSITKVPYFLNAFFKMKEHAILLIFFIVSSSLNALSPISREMKEVLTPLSLRDPFSLGFR